MQDGIFRSAGHKSRFVTAMQQLGKHDAGKLDPEYASAVYILTSDDFTWEKASGYVSRRGILFDDLLDEVDFSSGYRILIQLAGNLFNGGQHIDPVEFMRLDEGNFGVAQVAIHLRRHSAHLNDFKGEE